MREGVKIRLIFLFIGWCIVCYVYVLCVWCTSACTYQFTPPFLSEPLLLLVIMQGSDIICDGGLGKLVPIRVFSPLPLLLLLLFPASPSFVFVVADGGGGGGGGGGGIGFLNDPGGGGGMCMGRSAGRADFVGLPDLCATRSMSA